MTVYAASSLACVASTAVCPGPSRPQRQWALLESVAVLRFCPHRPGAGARPDSLTFLRPCFTNVLHMTSGKRTFLSVPDPYNADTC